MTSFFALTTADNLRLTDGTETVNVSASNRLEVNNVTDLVAQKTAGTATSRTDAYTVPTGKYWILKTANFNRTNAGANHIQVTIDSTSYNVYIGATTETITNYDLLSLRLKAGDTVSCLATTGTSGNIESHITYEEYTV